MEAITTVKTTNTSISAEVAKCLFLFFPPVSFYLPFPCSHGLSVIVGLFTFSKILCKWNSTSYIHFCPASFTQNNLRFAHVVPCVIPFLL